VADWPPTVDDLKLDMKVDPSDDRFDDALQQVLDAAVAYVQRTRTDVNFHNESDWDGPEVTDDLVLGTLRYARRLDYRRESVGGVIVADQMGSVPIAGWDNDIEKLLRIGRYARLRFA
jgi:hypothetical protein